MKRIYLVRPQRGACLHRTYGAEETHGDYMTIETGSDVPVESFMTYIGEQGIFALMLWGQGMSSLWTIDRLSIAAS
jgi:hypothetical protein